MTTREFSSIIKCLSCKEAAKEEARRASSALLKEIFFFFFEMLGIHLVFLLFPKL